MKYNQPLKDAPLPLWRRITALINVVLLTFYACLPGTVAAYELISDAFIASEVNNNPQFQISTNRDYLVEKAYYVTDITSTSTQTIASFHKKLLDHRKSSLPMPLMIPIMNDGITIIFPHYPLEKLIGDSFVQARFIRSQIFNQLNRNLLNDSTGTEALQINELYNRAFDFSAISSKRFGEQLTQTDVNTFGKNLIWPELRTVNNQKILVPVVHLTSATIDAQLVDSHVVEFGGAETQFNNITINAGTLLTRRNSLLNVAGNLNINEGAALKSSHDLNVLVGGTLQLTSGQISAEENVNIIAGQYLQKTMVHRYATKTTQGSRLGQIASVDANGNIYIKTMGDLVVKGGTISGNNIILKADGNIVLQAQETTYVRNEVVRGWNESESIIQQLGSQLTAEENIRLIASGAIEINASTLHADKGTIEILAGQGIYILDANNQFQSQRNGKFGRSTIQEQEFQTIAMRSALEAGKGIVIATELGDVNLKGTQLTSTNGTEIIARNGAVNFLLTKEQSNYFYNKVVKGFWKIKTTTIQDDVETAIYNEIVGGVKVQATHGMTLELGQYEDGDIATGINTETSRISAQIKTISDQIDALKRIGASTASLEAQRDELSQSLLNEQLAQLAQTDSLAWMQTLHNDPEYTDNFNIVYQELVELHKFDKTSTLSPAAMAIIAIAMAVAMGPAGFGAIGAGGTIAVQSATLTAALQAGALAIATQTATSLASGVGLEETIKSNFHSDNIKSVATAMVTAGAMEYFGGNLQLLDGGKSSTEWGNLTATQQTNFIINQGTQAIGNAAIRSGISSIINGGDLGDFEDAFVQNLAQSAISSIGKTVANKIGVLADGQPPQINEALRYIAHAGLGCALGAATAEINESETGLGCASGAGGAVIGEAVAQAYTESMMTPEQKEVMNWLKSKGIWTEAEFNALAPSEQIEYYNLTKINSINFSELTHLKDVGVDLAKLSGGLAAFIAGGEVNIASMTAENAAENNWLQIVVIAVRAAAALYTFVEAFIAIGDALTTYQKYQSLEGNPQAQKELLEDMAIDLGLNLSIDLALSKLKILEKITDALKEKAQDSKVVHILESWIESEKNNTPFPYADKLPNNSPRLSNLPSNYEVLPDGRIRIKGSSAIAKDSGYTTPDNRPIFQRESGGYYYIKADGTQQALPSPRTTGDFIKLEEGTYWEKYVDPKDRGRAIQYDLSQSDYKDFTDTDSPGFLVYDRATDRFLPAPAQNFPLIDYFNDTTAVSLKTIDTRGTSWYGSITAHIRDLAHRDMKINGIEIPKANRVIDIRVQPGGLVDTGWVESYAISEGITIIIKEFP